MDYLALKYTHVSCAVLSGLGFLLRGVWMASGSSRLHHRLTRTLPHLVDTLLLATAILMVLRLGQYPFTTPWLTAKVTALVAYIVLGALALRYAPSRPLRIAAFIAALSCYGYIVAVARARSPWPFA